MNLIDIASWQTGMDLNTMFQKNPALDGIIVKLTQGITYVNPPAADWLRWLSDNGKPFGVYHYLDIYGAEAEAEHFAKNAKPYIGKAVLAIDYEGNTLQKGTGYLKACLDKVYELTGVKPLVYCSQSVTQSQNFSAIAAAGYQLWMAQYADMNTVNGFVESPWHKGSVEPFSGYVMHQYTSCGRLDGWSGNLDFDLFNGSAQDWYALAGKKEKEPEPAPAPTPTPTPTKKKVDPKVVMDVLDNKYGIRTERVRKLKAAGYDPDEVQKKINELYNIANKVKGTVSGNLRYWECIGRILEDL